MAPSPKMMWKKYHVSAICPMATIGLSHGADGHASATRTHSAMTATAAPPLDSKNSGSGGMESVPNRALIVGSSMP